MQIIERSFSLLDAHFRYFSIVIHLSGAASPWREHRHSIRASLSRCGNMEWLGGRLVERKVVAILYVQWSSGDHQSSTQIFTRDCKECVDEHLIVHSSVFLC